MSAQRLASRSWYVARARLNSMPQCGKTMRMSAFLRASLMAANASFDLQGRAPGLDFVAWT